MIKIIKKKMLYNPNLTGLTREYGIPVAELNIGNKAVATSSALSRYILNRMS